MRPTKDEKIPRVPQTKIEVEVDTKVAEQLDAMAAYTKITRSELVTTALKRFIAGHKDYFPQDSERFLK
ncbi:MAG: hypothetical protein HYW49_12155 [Deltaproteobacteria bacterium]|nr:hypothetical protein [Deltaproteobacteria bacterium]